MFAIKCCASHIRIKIQFTKIQYWPLLKRSKLVSKGKSRPRVLLTNLYKLFVLSFFFQFEKTLLHNLSHSIVLKTLSIQHIRNIEIANIENFNDVLKKT